MFFETLFTLIILFFALFGVLVLFFRLLNGSSSVPSTVYIVSCFPFDSSSYPINEVFFFKCDAELYIKELIKVTPDSVVLLETSEINDSCYKLLFRLKYKK